MTTPSSPLNPWRDLPRGALKNPQGESFAPGEKIISELWTNNKGEFVRQNFRTAEEARLNTLEQHTLLARWERRIPDPKASDRATQSERLAAIFDFFCSLYESSASIESLTEEAHETYKEKEAILYWSAVWLERLRLLKEMKPSEGFECYSHNASGRKFLIKKINTYPPTSFLDLISDLTK